MQETLYRMAFEKIPEVISGIESGEYQIFNGILRRSDNFEIVKHIPLEPIDIIDPKKIDDLLEMAKHTQKLQIATTGLVAISTVAIMGTVVVATAYLGKKIDALQSQIAKVQQELQDQNILFYAEKVSRYFGQIEALREICSDQLAIKENNDYVVSLLAQSVSERNQLLAFMTTILHTIDRFSIEHKATAIDFITSSLFVLPKGTFIESQSAYKIERFSLGNNYRKAMTEKYNIILDTYKKWANNNYKRIVSGEYNQQLSNMLYPKLEDIKQLVYSEENHLILEYSV